jgi:hypothetical protein
MAPKSGLMELWLSRKAENVMRDHDNAQCHNKWQLIDDYMVLILDQFPFCTSYFV